MIEFRQCANSCRESQWRRFSSSVTKQQRKKHQFFTTKSGRKMWRTKRLLYAIRCSLLAVLLLWVNRLSSFRSNSPSCLAIKSLLEIGIPEEKMIFVNVISCPEGLNRLGREYPRVKIVTGMVDPMLNSERFIVPGLGDYGDRFFGTVE